MNPEQLTRVKSPKGMHTSEVEPGALKKRNILHRINLSSGILDFKTLFTIYSFKTTSTTL